MEDRQTAEIKTKTWKHLERPNKERGRQPCCQCPPNSTAALAGFVPGQGLCAFHWALANGMNAAKLNTPTALKTPNGATP